MSTAITQEQKQDIQNIVDFFFKNSMKLQRIDARVAELVYKMLEYAQQCSAGMDLVPRPAGVRPGLSYVLKQLAQAALRLKTNDKVYLACRDAVALKWRSALRLAEMGL